MRIGLLFGTFDPPHAGHIAIAEHIQRTQELDAVWLVVTPLNPFKQGVAISADQHRLDMVRLATAGRPGLEASEFEMDLPQPNYTADTLRFMRHRWPDESFSLILGSDNLAGFHRWKDPEDILEHHAILVYPRPGHEEHMAVSPFRHHPRIKLVLDAPLMDVSSTRIREDLRARRSMGDYLSQGVQEYIAEHGLYRS